MARHNGDPVTAGASERESGIVAAYLAGAKWSEIEEQFGVGRSTISHVLRRSGTLPSRQQRRLDQESAEGALSKLYELIRFQDERIIELEHLVIRYDNLLRRHGLTLDRKQPAAKKATKRKPAV